MTEDQDDAPHDPDNESAACPSLGPRHQEPMLELHLDRVLVMLTEAGDGLPAGHTVWTSSPTQPFAARLPAVGGTSPDFIARD